ncbi:hypothetical protein DENSPDRAFT_420719 [Dentipellis sp. KUC8613]|nr:hypothetical protein DENSPDRAFT_420719 [Dentipellis sp. KUC8613]
MDTSRVPPPSGNPPPYAMVARVYRSSLRPVVVAFGLVSGIWTLIWAIGLFKEVGTDKGQGQPKLANFSIALGALYMAAAVIEFFGVVSAVLQRLSLIRIYAFLSLFSTVIVIVAGLMRVIAHFVLKSNLLSECQNILTGQTVDFRWGIWGPHESKTLDAADAADWCKSAWNHDSWSEIVSLLIEIVLMGIFTMVAFSYYHQALDPTSAANASRVPVPQRDSFPSHYNPAYSPGGSGGSYDPYAGPTYAPPPGPPPGVPPYRPHDEEAGKLPGYGVGAGSGSSSTIGFETDDKKGDDPFADVHAHSGR